MIEDLTATMDFHITDMQTLKALLADGNDAAALGRPFSFPTSIRPRITRLRITFSQPLEFFRTIETSSRLLGQDRGHEPATTGSNSEDERGVAAWFQLPSRLLLQLPRLRILKIWLDHSGRDWWSVVDERAILSPLAELKKSHPGLELACILPNVHPKIEDGQRHYLPGETKAENLPPFTIHRVLRQIYRVVFGGSNAEEQVVEVVDPTGAWSQGEIVRVRDFPHLRGLLLSPDDTQAEVEELEAMIWRRGYNPEFLIAGARIREVVRLTPVD